MGWSYPNISLEELMKLIKAFIDMLLLAPGYQSTGKLAHWNADSIKKALQWALFLENVSKGLTRSNEFRVCVEELDTALLELSTNSNFPQALGPLSCADLSRARELLLERLIQTFPLRELHLKAIITASVGMDLDGHRLVNDDCLDLYIEKLMLNASRSRSSSEGQSVSFPPTVLCGKHEDRTEGDCSLVIIQELERRELAASFLSSVENGLEILLETQGQSIQYKLRENHNEELMQHSPSLISEELPVESWLWNHWKSRSLSYMLDKRTTRLVSGASLIFSSPKNQWDRMFERLNPSDENDDSLCEIIELLLLGCISNRWTALIQHVMSVSYKRITISRLYSEVFNLPQGTSRDFFSNDSFSNVKEKGIIEYLEVLLRGHLNQLWKLSPVVAAVAIPSWSQLFRSYLMELEGQIRGNSSATRCCTCINDGVEHRNCDLIERIWCLHVCHFNPAVS